ncbi:DUF1223 domain-containing protein [Emcibacter sp.]|uniref:DUF1223 domain-containing protein n=1 Tax=Emcibacter sp. TaxID=1979954 RepID=UPI002AA7C62E|nr:DUF1223 domain-containing protein [Emcibacter sp.]
MSQVNAEKLSVVELFTSQGCSSCPPADDLLRKLSLEENILALSYSVDYWNYLGWKDIFARPEFTKRQKHYSRILSRGEVYTPQMIINGRSAVVGSRQDMVQKYIDEQAEKPVIGPEISLYLQDDMINLTVSSGSAAEATGIWLVAYDTVRSVKIKSGELAGQTREYVNVVRGLKRIGSWTGREVMLSLDPAEAASEKCDNYAILVQQKDTGVILSAARIRLEKPL